MFKVAVLASGSGTNLQAIIDRLHKRADEIEVVLVVSDVPEARALERARAAGIKTAVFPHEGFSDRQAHDAAMADAIGRAGADLVVLAGYMHMLTPDFLARFPWRVINLHPALLPSFPGTHGIEDAVRYGVKVTGVSVHFVDDGMDTGPIIRQELLRVRDDDTVASLAERIHALEHQVLPRVIQLFVLGRVVPPKPGSRVVRVIEDEE